MYIPLPKKSPFLTCHSICHSLHAKRSIPSSNYNPDFSPIHIHFSNRSRSFLITVSPCNRSTENRTLPLQPAAQKPSNNFRSRNQMERRVSNCLASYRDLGRIDRIETKSKTTEQGIVRAIPGIQLAESFSRLQKKRGRRWKRLPNCSLGFDRSERDADSTRWNALTRAKPAALFDRGTLRGYAGDGKPTTTLRREKKRGTRVGKRKGETRNEIGISWERERERDRMLLQISDTAEICQRRSARSRAICCAKTIATMFL